MTRLLIILTVLSLQGPLAHSPLLAGAPGIRCFYSGESVSGQNKICYYDCLGSAAAITIKAYQLCPFTIDR